MGVGGSSWVVSVPQAAGGAKVLDRGAIRAGKRFHWDSGVVAEAE